MWVGIQGLGDVGVDGCWGGWVLGWVWGRYWGWIKFYLKWNFFYSTYFSSGMHCNENYFHSSEVFFQADSNGENPMSLSFIVKKL